MRELIAFGVVGIAATFVHYSTAIAFIEWLSLEVLIANFLAYCIAVGVSFLGHSRITFRTEMTRQRLVKFVVASVSALLFSQLLLFVLTNLGWFGHRINMVIIVCFVPCYSYILNKFWVYDRNIAQTSDDLVSR